MQNAYTPVMFKSLHIMSELTAAVKGFTACFTCNVMDNSSTDASLAAGNIHVLLRRHVVHTLGEKRGVKTLTKTVSF